jgi:squalene-associated FAD-dependent desaturase
VSGRDPILVLGGGLAGLSAATALAEDGGRVVLLEGRGGLGGRAQSFTHRRTGDELDTGQHVLMGCYHEMLRFLDRVGTRGLVRMQRSLQVELAAPGGVRARLACQDLPAPLHLAAGLMGHGLLSLREKLACARVMGDARSREHDPALDQLSVSEWLTHLGQSENAQRVFWTPVCLAVLNATPEQASASLLAVVLVRAFMGPGDDSSIGLATAGLTQLHGAAAVEYIESRGGQVRLNEPVVALIVEQGRARGVTLRDGSELRGRAIISGLAADSLRRVLPEHWRQRGAFAGLAEFKPSPIVSLHLWLDRKILDVPFVGLIGTQLHWVFDRELVWGTPARAGHLVSLVVSGADELAAMNREAVLELCWNDLISALPEARGAAILDWEVVKERAATFRGRPGLARHRFGPESPLPGLLVAGDWTDTGLPATMEGACASGHRAAERVAR